MPTLRKCLRHPGIYLALLGLTVALGMADGFRAPERQLTGPAYIALVHLYQHRGRAWLEGHVQCRFKPTCSDYSIDAVRKYGMVRGIGLTANRLWRCRKSVPLGSLDPVS